MNVGQDMTDSKVDQLQVCLDKLRSAGLRFVVGTEANPLLIIDPDRWPLLMQNWEDLGELGATMLYTLYPETGKITNEWTDELITVYTSNKAFTSVFGVVPNQNLEFMNSKPMRRKEWNE